MPRKKKPADEAVKDTPAPAPDWQPTEVGGVAPDLYDLATGRQVVPDPLAVVAYTGNAETDSLAEMEALQEGFAQRKRKRLDSGRELNTDSEYWCCLCFQTREQKEAFLVAMGWIAMGDKYLDGVELARRQGVALPSSEDLRFVTAKPDKTLNELALPLED